MYKAIIFDFFDVIHTDTSNAWREKHGFTRQGVFEDASILMDKGEITMEEYYQRLSKASSLPVESIKSEFEKFSHVDQAVVDLIQNLHKHYKLGLVSNAEGQYLRNILTKYQLESLFDIVVISGEVRLAKPEPEIFLHILEKLETAATDAIFIDDSEVNIKAAQTLGIKGLHYRDLANLETELKEIGITV